MLVNGVLISQLFQPQSKKKYNFSEACSYEQLLSDCNVRSYLGIQVCNQIPLWYWPRHKILSSINQLQSSLVPYKPFSSDFLNCPVIGQKISCRQQISCGQTGRLNGVRCTVHTATWESRALRNSLQLSKSEIKSNLKLVMYKLEIRSTEISQQSLIK